MFTSLHKSHWHVIFNELLMPQSCMIIQRYYWLSFRFNIFQPFYKSHYYIILNQLLSAATDSDFQTRSYSTRRSCPKFSSPWLTSWASPASHTFCLPVRLSANSRFPTDECCRSASVFGHMSLCIDAYHFMSFSHKTHEKLFYNKYRYIALYLFLGNQCGGFTWTSKSIRETS